MLVCKKLSKFSIKVPRGVNMTPISRHGPTQVLVHLSNSSAACSATNSAGLRDIKGISELPLRYEPKGFSQSS